MRPKAGMFKALCDNKSFTSNCMYECGGLTEFERIFETWHHGILLTKITYYQTEYGNNCFDSNTKPFVIINQLGYFDNMNIFARRLYNEIFLSMEEPKDNQPTAVNVTFRGDCLEIDVEGNIKYSLQATFVDKNQEYFNDKGNILKFEIN